MNRNIIIDGIIFHLQNYGGISVYFNELINRLESDSFKVNFINYSVNPKFNFIDLKSFILKKPRFMERYRKCIINDSASLFHSSYYRLPNIKVPIITTVHDFTYERFFSGPKLWVHSSQKFNAIRKSDFIICISENTRNDLFYFFPNIHPDKVKVIYNGVSNKFTPLNLSSNTIKPYIIFVGARKGYKNFASLVMALKHLHEFNLLCVGGGNLDSNERDLIEKNISGRFEIRLFVTEAELNLLYNYAYCLVYPSAYEGFGIPVLEAMKAGCPVVAYDNSSIPEIAGDSAVLIDSVNPDSIRDAILSLSSNQFRIQIKAMGLIQSNKFSWDRTYCQTKKIYNNFIKL